MSPNQLSILLYNLTVLPVIFFSILFVILTIISVYVDRRGSAKRRSKLNNHPFITIQIPTFNDPIARRCLDACRQLEYPKDRYEILIVDDSTDNKTTRTLRQYAQKYDGVHFFHRKKRDGYKPGALKDVHKHVKGDFIVIFDADFIPPKEFLKEIIKPFEDPGVAIVQGRQGFLNSKKNLVTRWATYLLQIHHFILMPINNRCNTVFFCGTAGAIRKSAMEAVGGWNTESITEDSDLSVRLLAQGWKTVYLTMETPSEVPETIEAFLKQQMRWCFGNTRVFFDNWRQILYKKGLTIKQRLLITYFTLGNLVAPVILLMTIVGFLGWFTGTIHLFGLKDLIDFFVKFFYTAGFLIMGIVMLVKRRSPREFPHLVLAAFTLGLLLAAANSIAIYKALLRKEKPLFGSVKNSWICTPKSSNRRFR